MSVSKRQPPPYPDNDLGRVVRPLSMASNDHLREVEERLDQAELSEEGRQGFRGTLRAELSATFIAGAFWMHDHLKKNAKVTRYLELYDDAKRGGGRAGDLLKEAGRLWRAMTPDEHATVNTAVGERERAAQKAVVVDQPPPVATSRRPAWDIVIEYTEARRSDNAYGKDGTLDLVLADMRERDRLGRERYGVPLTSGNGRNHLVDAYQEALDFTVYLAAELDEHHVLPSTIGLDLKSEEGRRLFFVRDLFSSQLLVVTRMRALIGAMRTP